MYIHVDACIFEIRLKSCQVPVLYAYATTMRRAQGSTLELTGLFFDRRRADRGYAYVGVSRVKWQADAYHIGPIRRSDWRPVGGDPDGNEQEHPGPMSESDEDNEVSASSDHSNDSDDLEHFSDYDYDPTAWNAMPVRRTEDPMSEDEENPDPTPPTQSTEEPYPSPSDFGYGTSSEYHWPFNREERTYDPQCEWRGLFD